jgi:hypothetical protein
LGFSGFSSFMGLGMDWVGNLLFAFFGFDYGLETRNPNQT